MHPAHDKSVERLLEEVHKGEFALPQFQRTIEWQPNQVSDLLTSIVSKYFSGLLLFWEIDSETEKMLSFYPVPGVEKADHVNFAILDGQQRLFSLHYAIYNPNITFPNRASYYLFYLDIDKCFNGDTDSSVYYGYSPTHTPISSLKSRKDEFLNELKFPLALLSDEEFKRTELRQWINEYSMKLMKKYHPDYADGTEESTMKILDTANDVQGFIQGVIDYEFTTHVLDRKNKVKDVSLMFARLNQKGLKLSMFDLMNAFLFGYKVELRKIYEDGVGDQLKDIPGMDEYLLKFMALVKREYSSPKYVYSLVPEQEDVQIIHGKREKVTPIASGAEFLKLWKDAMKFSEEARVRIQNVSYKSFGAIKSDFIPNTTIIPVLAALMKIYKEEYKDKILENDFDRIISRWYWSAVFSGEYSGSSDTVMSKDFRDLKDWLKSKDSSKIARLEHNNLQRIIDNLDLTRAKKGSSVYNAIISLIALKGGRDFYEGFAPGSVDYSSRSINDHHIFPSKVRDLDKDKSDKFNATKDTILNRTLLLDRTNKDINNQKPSVYINKILNDKMGGDRNGLEELMAKHFISKNGLNFLLEDDYDKFILERENTIKNEIERCLI